MYGYDFFYGMAALFAGMLLDTAIGDPHGFPHMVIGIGKLISLLERLFRKLFPAGARGELAGGILLVVLVCVIPCGVCTAILYFAYRLHFLAGIALEAFFCWQCIALTSLRRESMAVFQKLEQGDVPGARKALSMIVGRDTDALDEKGAARAAVETVAENLNDGVIAPLLFLFIGGAPLGVLYKSINTMDSMLGYRNEKYLYFGRAAARLDDAANFIPARLSALFMTMCCRLAGLNAKNAWRIFKRDRYNHKSPNSAQTEAAMAGALGIRLAGPAVYFGKPVEKPYIGDGGREIGHDDIRLANRLAWIATLAFFIVCAALKGLLIWL